MMTTIAIGLAVATGCLVIQSLTALLAMRCCARVNTVQTGKGSAHLTLASMILLLSVLSVGSIVQMLAWSIGYGRLGRFEDFETALYFSSGVTFTSLGFGDVVPSGHVRLLEPLQAANGLIMFGFCTAVLMNALRRPAEIRDR